MAETHDSHQGKKSSKKLIIIIVIALLVLGGGGAGAYFYFFNKPVEAEHGKGKSAKKGGHPAVEETKHEEAKHEEKPEAEHDPKAEVDTYYELPGALIVDFPAGSSAKVIKVALTVLVKGEAAAAVLKKNEPMVRNNLLMIISALGADKAKTTEGKQALQTSILTEIGKILEKMTGKNTAKDVYFIEFVMQ